ncbi:DUF2752 domain-containing protein [Pedobacter sp. NJ-S-72]
MCYVTGYDCPGCGFQRSFLALLKGDFYHFFLSISCDCSYTDYCDNWCLCPLLVGSEK